ncbi:hypothetical protein ANN_24905 [Periplaneta americana]|uniref:Uncharacterized protein n=1 Tax=Periplaneta americana TaxID=6978 RepID=A0ABQ8RZX1_PERAM|nr:hypothetical protein ANN_24905 [Periplaneta americana]
MSLGSSTESYPAFARIGLRENPGKNLNQVTCPDWDPNPGHLVSQPDALTFTPQVWTKVISRVLLLLLWFYSQVPALTAPTMLRSRVQLFKTMTPNTLLPPEPILTCWGNWIIAALESVREFINSSESSDTVSIEIMQNVLSDEKLEGNLSFILAHFSTLSAGLPLNQSNVFDTTMTGLMSITVEESYDNIEEVLEKEKKGACIILMGNWNAVVGEGEDGRTVLKYGLRKGNDRGES